MKKLLLVDGSNLLFQMFFGMPARIANEQGKAIQGTLGFVGALLKIIRMVEPTHVAVLFDGETHNPRTDLDAGYKANREDYSEVEEEENPFSTYKPSSLYSMNLRRAVAEAKGAHRRNRYLTYGQVRRMFDVLSEDESELLTDYIIRLYLPIDKDMLMSYYASCYDMLNAMRSTAGGEYDIREVFNPGSDKIFEQMAKYVHDELQMYPTRKIITLPGEARLEIAGLLSNRFAPSKYELSKFLHLKFCGR